MWNSYLAKWSAETAAPARGGWEASSETAPNRQPGSRGRGWLAGLAGLSLAFTASQAAAQDGADQRVYPLNQMAPPGRAAEWSAIAHPDTAGYFQPIRVELPTKGRVAFFSKGLEAAPVQAAPAEAAMLIGPVYRLQISHLPEFPGVELYPTVELLDRLHAPVGREADFPVPIAFTLEEIQFALEGRLVTKVVYLEQPDRADPFRPVESAPTEMIGPAENSIAVADAAGRPMALVRIGGRIPDPADRESAFYGTGAPLLFRHAAVPRPQTQNAQRKAPPNR